MRLVPTLSLPQAAALVKDGDVLLVGGFGMTGSPVHLLHALAQTQTRNLTYISNNVGEPGLGGGRLLRNGQLAKVIGSFITSNPEAVGAAQEGKIDVELIPQGSLAEAIRSGGAGIGGFYTPTSAGTEFAARREGRIIDGKLYIFQRALRGNVAFVRAWRADPAGNLIYRRTEQNFNKAMCMAANIVIAEVEEIVPLGQLPPETIHTQGLYVDYLVQARTRLEDLGVSSSVEHAASGDTPLKRQIAKRALAELKRGDIVNLGVGIPTLIADLIQPDHGIVVQTENGMLGLGPSPKEGGALDFAVDAGKRPVTSLPGSSYFDSVESFAMIRGGHIHVAVLGGLQADEKANLANWSVPGKPLLGVGGAMDLAQGARRLIVTMTHTGPNGEPKILPKCTLPLTAQGKVDTIITELGVFKFISGELTLVDLMPGVELETVKAKTHAKFLVAVP